MTNDFPQWGTRNVIPIGLPDRFDLPLLLDLNSSTDDFELQVPFLSHLNVSSQPICRNPSLQTNSAFSPGTKMLLLQPGRHFNMAFATGGFGVVQFFSCNESILGDENSVLGWRHPVISTAKHMISREVVHIKDFILLSEIHTMIIAACLAKSCTRLTLSCFWIAWQAAKQGSVEVCQTTFVFFSKKVSGRTRRDQEVVVRKTK